jgi:hypothetical protein
LEALIETLVDEGVIGREWADALESTREFGDGREVAEAAREGRGPPTFAASDSNGGGGGNGGDG